MFLDERMCHSERSKAKSKNLLLMSALSLLFLSGCTLYDNYDIDLMEGAASNTEQSSDSGSVDPTSSNTDFPVSPESSGSFESSASASIDCGSPLNRGRDHKTVLIGEQCWMAENLDYETTLGNSMCFDNNAANCAKYGRLYDYEAASHACPTGWRLPTSAEYDKLKSLSGAQDDYAGEHFKATSGWASENGDDKLKFSALPGGFCTDAGVCKFAGSVGYWWTSTEEVMDETHYVLYLSKEDQRYTASMYVDNVERLLSVRCVKD